MRNYENLELIHENTLPPRAHYIPYDTLEKALKGEKSASAYYKLLNGEWDFRYFARDIDCPEEITSWEIFRLPEAVLFSLSISGTPISERCILCIEIQSYYTTKYMIDNLILPPQSKYFPPLRRSP